MRISAGNLKGRALNFRFKEKPMPTTGLVKKALFSILGSSIRDSLFLDLFAGSGAVGVEAFSHGAKEAWFAEHDPELARSLKTNFDLLKISGGVLHDDAQRACTTLRRLKKEFNYIYLDPPYHKNLLEPSLQAISKNHLFADGCIIICERAKNETPLSENILKTCSLSVFDSRTYGISSLDFLRHTRTQP